MKTKSFACVLALLCVLFSQMQSMQAKEVFYYYWDEKIFLEERADKIFLKLDLTVATKEKLLDLKNEIESFELVSDIHTHEAYISPFVLIETKNGDDVPPALYERCKANEMVLSATNVLEYKHALQGLTDEFAVHLKASSSYEQLEELALQNKCVIENDIWVGIDQYMLSVSKTSELNSLQTANLFYETGLFEYASPNGVILNAFVDPTGVPDIHDADSEAELFQNYPNPFGQSTTIRYTLLKTGQSARIIISDTTGNILKQIPLQAGTDSITVECESLSAGIYYYSLYVGNELVDTKKMILTK
jgi:hypothetical protein